MDRVLTHILSSTDARSSGADKWFAHCPAHGSKRHRDLSIRLTDGRILLHCFGACELQAVVAALGLRVGDLFTRYMRALHGQRPAPQPPRLNRIALAFRFELAALDHRLRAQKILDAAGGIEISTVNEENLDRALHHVGQAYADRARAALFEHVADTLRENDFAERTLRERTTRAA